MGSQSESFYSIYFQVVQGVTHNRKMNIANIGFGIFQLSQYFECLFLFCGIIQSPRKGVWFKLT